MRKIYIEPIVLKETKVEELKTFEKEPKKKKKLEEE